MTTIDSADILSKPDQIWTLECLKDNIFVNLMENGYDKETKSNNYILQFVDKFRFLRLKSPSTFFEIDPKDLCSDTIKQIDNYAKDCKTTGERYHKLNGVIVEVIARIAKQAEPEIMSLSANDDNELFHKVQLCEIREMASRKWRLIDEVQVGSKNE